MTILIASKWTFACNTNGDERSGSTNKDESYTRQRTDGPRVLVNTVTGTIIVAALSLDSFIDRYQWPVTDIVDRP